MKHLAWLGITIFLALVACAEQMPSTTPTRDELGQLVDAQTQATIAAAKMQSLQRAATTQADATRQYLILQGQQTRIAQDAAATATTFAGNGTATRQAVHATQTTFAGHATTTQVAAQFTATAHAQNIAATATANAANAQATQASASATATANAVIVEQTRASASATATARAADARATRASGDATATVIAAQVIATQEKAEWDKRLEAGRAVASFVFGALVLVGLVLIIGFGALRFIDAGVLRARIFRDKTGTVFVVSERDEDGRQTIFIPSRAPGAVVDVTPPGVAPYQVTAGAIDPDVTKRDQAIALMLAATNAPGKRTDALARELTAGGHIQIVDAPPQQLVAPEVKQLLDGDWQHGGNDRGNDK